MKANKGFKTTKKTHLFATRGFLTFLVILHLYGDYPHCSLLARKLNKQNKLRTTTTTTLYSVYPCSILFLLTYFINAEHAALIARSWRRYSQRLKK